MKEKEKVIGGVLNINQFFWVLGGLLLGAGMLAMGYKIVGGVFASILALPVLLSGIPFAVYKKNGLTLFQYIMYKRKFKSKVQKLPNIRKEVKF